MKNITSNTSKLADTVGFEIVGADLGSDIKSAIQTALSAGVVFPKGSEPLSIFREVLARTLHSIETHHREPLFKEFLLKGPYENSGAIPKKLIDERLSDSEVASVITFIYSHMVNCFKGAVTELLAASACVRLLKRLQRDSKLPANAYLYVGDVVGVHRPKGKGLLKGADLYLLINTHKPNAVPDIYVAGLVEVKSYFCSERRLREQFDRHIRRLKEGLQVAGRDYARENVCVGFGPSLRFLQITVLPSNWSLPRTFRFENTEHGRLLHVDPGVPPCTNDEIIMTGNDEWRIILRWSKEALAEAAYEMTFWYMEKVGEMIYSHCRPMGWEEMSEGEAGRNAAKMTLYYALLRCRTTRENQRAIALYNTYGFGYALGMNYRNAEGKREMLWPQDLDEIISGRKTKHGCRIH